MMTIHEISEALEGVGLLLEDMAGNGKKPRNRALVAAVRECVGSPDALAEQLEESSRETEKPDLPTR